MSNLSYIGSRNDGIFSFVTDRQMLTAEVRVVKRRDKREVTLTQCIAANLDDK